MEFPASLKYLESHEWINIQGDTGKVGISDFAQKELGDIVFVELPEVGRQVKAQDACVVVESVKTASDVYSPVSGTIVAVNEKLQNHPELINDDCYGEGWIFQIKLSNPSEVDKLLSAEDYEKNCTH